jgi:hypothetical protein
MGRRLSGGRRIGYVSLQIWSVDASAHGALGNVAAVEAHTCDISRKSHSPGTRFFCWLESPPIVVICL